MNSSNATRAAEVLLLPEIAAQVLAFGDAGDLLRSESTARALRDVIRSREQSLWGALTRAAWPVEGAALCSLGDERRVFRAFRTKRPARTNIRSRVYSDDLHAGADDLAFVATVGCFAGVAHWEIPVDVAHRVDSTIKQLHWRPLPDATHFDQPESRSSSPEPLPALAASLHVIDMRSFQCVTLISDVSPDDIEILRRSYEDMGLQKNDVLTYPHHSALFSRHNIYNRRIGKYQDFDERDNLADYEDEFDDGVLEH